MYNYIGDDSVNKIYKRETYLKKIRGFYNDSEMIKVRNLKLIMIQMQNMETHGP